MKKLIIPILSVLVISCTNSSAQDTKFQEKINKEFTVLPNSVLAVYNIDGHIKVEGYDGNKVLIEVDKTISGKTNEIMEQGKREFRLEFEQKDDSVIVYIAEPWDSRPKTNRWNNDQRKIHYHHNLNFTIKVPKTLNLSVSTINNGDIVVNDVEGFMKVNNINGKITVNNAKNANEIHTINGDVNINYVALPPDNSQYYTLNGKLTVVFPDNLSADCSFKSFNGEFYTDFENIEKLPSKITKTTKENEGGTVHKLNKGSAIRIGSGGKNLKFETFNGNIYIKKS
ncbi:hypothetical protein EGI26_02440 [Lacihabitans sp. CCS-44]|uniref:hypothetical protein n=1 Tax=Lacihabitans sp. CCS-44 TaxID=2487331 RepID=UPI0020CDA020|nr:hypothetical protein [Lacihabitans sp. CCS-44]MCP9754020.1 hypothetical protein [Lacihabitans sp. CCS-44]